MGVRDVIGVRDVVGAADGLVADGLVVWDTLRVGDVTDDGTDVTDTDAEFAERGGRLGLRGWLEVRRATRFAWPLACGDCTAWFSTAPSRAVAVDTACEKPFTTRSDRLETCASFLLIWSSSSRRCNCVRFMARRKGWAWLSWRVRRSSLTTRR